MRRGLFRRLSALEHRAARTLLSLPHELQTRLVGGPVHRDGQALHPELALLLALRKLRPAPSLAAGAPSDARRRFRRELLQHAGPRVEVGAVRDHELDVGRPLKVRHYAPRSKGSAREPLLVFLHGGGFALGDLDTHDPVCRMLARHAGVHVLAVEYRLAPEHPFPAAFEDARAALRWAREHAESLGADPSRLCVGGDSAGGNLSAAVAKVARDDDVELKAQLLLYPAIDRSVVRPSLELFAEGFFLSRHDVETFERWYIPREHRDDPRHAPFRGGPLASLPPALVVTAGFDPLRDEGEAYAAAMRDAGTAVVHRRYEGFPHGFVNLVGLSAACRHAVVEIARELRALLDGVGAGHGATPPSARERVAASSERRP